MKKFGTLVISALLFLTLLTFFVTLVKSYFGILVSALEPNSINSYGATCKNSIWSWTVKFLEYEIEF